MKQISTIKEHSFIDVITNSSTELFPCRTDKTVEMVKEVLQKIVDGYNMMTDSNYSMDMFKEPWVFNLEEYRKWKREDKENRDCCKTDEDWQKYYDGCSKFSTVDGWFHDDENEEDLKYLRKDYIENGDNSDGWWSSDRNQFHGRIMAAIDAYKTIQVSLGENKHINTYEVQRAEVDKIYKEISDSDEKPDWWNHPWTYHHNSTLVKELDGCVMVCGSDDNSIPYEIWEIINSKLNATNYHLG